MSPLIFRCHHKSRLTAHQLARLPNVPSNRQSLKHTLPRRKLPTEQQQSVNYKENIDLTQKSQIFTFPLSKESLVRRLLRFASDSTHGERGAEHPGDSTSKTSGVLKFSLQISSFFSRLFLHESLLGCCTSFDTFWASVVHWRRTASDARRHYRRYDSTAHDAHRS